MRKVLFVLLTLFAFNASAEKADAMEDLKTMLDKIHTLSGRFDQSIKDIKGQEVQQASKGKFSLKRPGYFLWESEAPFNQLVVGTPDSMKIYDPDLEQLTSYPKGTNDQSNPAHLLSGDLSSLRANFTVTKTVEAKSDDTTFTLIPIKSDTSYKQIVFQFTKDTLTELKFLDKLDQTTDIAFSKLELNSAIKDELFNFVAPEGTDIITNNES